MVGIAGCTERWNRVRCRSTEAWDASVNSLRAAARATGRSDTNWQWVDEPCALAPVWRSNEQTVRVGIRIGSYTLVVLDRHDQLVKTKPLFDLSSSQIVEFANAHGAAVPQGAAAPIANAEPSLEVLAEIERWVSNGHATIQNIVRATDGAEPVRVDGDSLNVLTRIVLPTRNDEPQRSVRAGFAMVADAESQAAEVWIQASPSPDDSRQRMPLTDIVAARDRDAQAKAVEAFLTNGLIAAYGAVHREWRPRPSVPPAA